MSIFQSLTVGVTAVQSQSNALGMISDNIANVNTVGYKRGSALFRDLLGNGTSSGYSPAGAASLHRSINESQGEIIGNSGSNAHLAINGRGFFAVSQTSPANGGIVYTRAGAFEPNVNGDFVNGAGFFLQGWPLDQNGALDGSLNDPHGIASATAIAALRTVNIANLDAAPIPTTAISPQINLKSSQQSFANSTVSVQANLNSSQIIPPTANVAIVGNLQSAETAFAPAANYDPTMSVKNMASGAVPPNFSRAVSVFDNTGAAHTLKASFLKTDDDTWAVEISTVPATDVTQTDGQLAYGTVTFNPDGTLATISPALTSAVTADWNNVGGPSDITFDFGTIDTAGGLSQINASYSASLTPSPDYDPTVTGKSMTSGAVTPDFTHTVTVTDNIGVVRTLNVSFLKTGDNMWAVEIYGQPLTDVTATGAVAGQVAYGTATFKSDGTLDTISSSLSGAVPVGWNGNSPANSVAFNWTASGAFTGLSQLNSAYAATITSAKNYDSTDITKNMASGSVTPSFNRQVTVIDDGGVSHTLTFGFLKTGTNNWAVEIYTGSAADVTSGNAQLAAGILTFNGDGTLASINGGLGAPIAIDWQPSGNNQITVDWGTAGAVVGTPGATVIGMTDGMTQLDGNFDVAGMHQNGSAAGELTGINITGDGTLVGLYADGSTRDFYKIPLAIFTDGNQLQSISGNAFTGSEDSSPALFFQANGGSAGKIESDGLESSNVDLQTELTNMIVAQRAYQTNTKIVSTSDDMLQTLTQMLGQ